MFNQTIVLVFGCSSESRIYQACIETFLQHETTKQLAGMSEMSGPSTDLNNMVLNMDMFIG